MLNQRTRLNVTPSGRGRILLYFDESQLEFVKNEFVDELLKMKDCAVFYYDSGTPLDSDEKPDSIQMIIVLVNDSLLNSGAEDLSAFLNKAGEDNIPVVPLLTERIQIEGFEKKFGKVQYITWYQESETAIGFREKLNSMLDLYLVTDDLRNRIIAGFRKKIFLSYRKSDRAQAKELIKQIHRVEENSDIAIWYDEMLVAGDEYNMAILDELKSSDVFLLCVTPNVLKKVVSGEDTYVKRIEIPSAREYGKKIIAVEMVPTEPGWQNELGIEDSECVPFEDVSSVCTEKLGGCSIIDMNPEKQYLAGLAYLNGILVEKDVERGIKLVKTSAEGNYIPAIREMKDRYFIGNGLPRDYAKSYFWLESLVDRLEPEKRFYELEINLQKFYEAGETGPIYLISDKMKELAKQKKDGSVIDKIYCQIELGKIYSYIGDARFKDGDLEDAVRHEQTGCEVLENLWGILKDATIPEEMMLMIVFEMQIKKALAVNYDHLTDYLTRLGRKDEAKAVIDKRKTLFDNSSDSGANDDFYGYVRRSENFKNEKDFDSAEQCLVKALALFEEKNAGSSDWKIKREKAVVLYKLAEVYIMRKNLDDAQIETASDYLLKAFEIIDEILKYNPQDAEVLRDKTICLELAAHIFRHMKNVRMMIAKLCESEKLRAYIAENFPSEMAEADLEHIREVIQSYGYYPKKFMLSDKRTTDEYGNPCAVLYPARGITITFRMSYRTLNTFR